MWPIGLASFGLQLPLVPACSLFAQLADGGAVMLDRLMRVLRAPASTLTQRNIVNDASQSGRRNPSNTLRDESGSCFDDRLIAVTIGCGKNGIHNPFRKRRLLASELAQIDVPFERLNARLPTRNVLDIIANIEHEHWTHFTRHFGPLSGIDPQIRKATERYLLTIFAVERRKMVHLLEDLQEHQQTKARSLAPG